MENSSIDETIDAGSSESKIPLILAVAALVLGGLSFVFSISTKSTISRKLAEFDTKIEAAVQRAEQAAADARNVGSNGENFAALRVDFDSLKNNTEMGFKDANTAYARVVSRINEIETRLGRNNAGAGTRPAAGTPANTARNNPSAATPASANGEKYKVQQGDNPSKIAKKFGVPVNDLMNANPGLDPRKLRVGQEINVPAKK